MELVKPKPRWFKVIDSGGIQPKYRHGHRAVAINKFMYVFGGGNDGIFDELIVYDTASNNWFEPAVAGDIPPGCAAFGCVVNHSQILVFGGMVEYGNYCNELYALETLTWRWKRLNPLASGGDYPCPRLGHSCTLIGNKVYIFGGLSRNSNEINGSDVSSMKYLNDLYILHLQSGRSVLWEKPITKGTPPSARESHSAVAHTDTDGNSKLVIYGGTSGYRLGDLWILDIDSMTWGLVKIAGPQPLPRSLHSATEVNGKMYVFGGWVPTSMDSKSECLESKCTNQLACLNLNTMKWELITEGLVDGNVPRARAGHSAAVVDGRIYIWSGRDGYRKAWNNQVCCKDLWYLEVCSPQPVGKVQLYRAQMNSLGVCWTPVPSVEDYCLQIQKLDLSSTTTRSLISLLPVSQPLHSSKLSSKIISSATPSTSQDIQPTTRPIKTEFHPEIPTPTPPVQKSFNPVTEEATTPTCSIPLASNVYGLPSTHSSQTPIGKLLTQNQPQILSIKPTSGTIPKLSIVLNKPLENGTVTGAPPRNTTFKLGSTNPKERSLKILPHFVTYKHSPMGSRPSSLVLRKSDGTMVPIKLAVIGNPQSRKLTEQSQIGSTIRKSIATNIPDTKGSITESISGVTPLESVADISQKANAQGL